MLNEDLELIMMRINIYFKKLSGHQYSIRVAYNKYDQNINFFFINKSRVNTRSIPLHTIDTTDLEYFEELINAIKSRTGLSIYYTGFTGMRFPKSNKIIQRKRGGTE